MWTPEARHQTDLTSLTKSKISIYSSSLRYCGWQNNGPLHQVSLEVTSFPSCIFETFGFNFLHVLIPWTCDYVTLQGKRDFEDVTHLRILRWGHYSGGSPGYPGGPNLTIRVLKCWEPFLAAVGGKYDYGRLIRDARLLALKTVEVGTSEGMWTASRSWKRQGLPLKASSMEYSSVHILILEMRLVLEFQPPQMEDRFVLF